MNAVNYYSPSELRSFLEARGLGMRKKYGQNFLVNSVIRNKLLDALEINAGQSVWEIGPGLGVMTGGLLERGAKVCAFEIDRGFSLILREFFGDNRNFNLVEGDVLKTWLKEIQNNNDIQKPCLLGNLPYNIAAVLLADFITKKQFFEKMVITVQLETANRLIAKPDSREYSSITVLCSSFYKITPLMVIKGSSFFPVPKVDSRGLRLDLRDDITEPPRLFFSLLRSLFSSRRKTVQNNLINFTSSVIMNKNMDSKRIAAQALEQAGIAGGRRAETFENIEFYRLAKALEDLTGYGN